VRDSGVTRPRNHPQRIELNDEVHARPQEPLLAPLRLSYLVMLCDFPQRAQAWQAVRSLAEQFGVPPPAANASYFSADFGPFRLRCEAHTEFMRYTFMVTDPACSGLPADGFTRSAIDAVPSDWVVALPGQVMVAAHAVLVDAADEDIDVRSLAGRFFEGNLLVGARIAGVAGTALTDFRIHADGFSRLLVLDHGMNAFQAGRMVQHLLEIDTYRIMALLALPVARELTPFLTQRERELAAVTTALVSAGELDEPVLLERLTRLQAEIESRHSDSLYRFSAADAYYDLVQQRIVELREDRIQGLQTFREFTERRLAPAMNTCRSVAARQESLSQRVAQATQLLSTRVDVSRERQNQALLASMNRRASLQLRLQSTVEGLSIAAVTYYIVGLVGHAAEGLHAMGMAVVPDIAMAISIPIVGVLVAFGLHRTKRMVTRPGPDGHEL
jgi:uncharacterized membrane-anchored protein